MAELGGAIVFNEVPRLFAMPPPKDPAEAAADDLFSQYLRYT